MLGLISGRGGKRKTQKAGREQRLAEMAGAGAAKRCAGVSPETVTAGFSVLVKAAPNKRADYILFLWPINVKIFYRC